MKTMDGILGMERYHFLSQRSINSMIIPESSSELECLRRLDPQVISTVYDRYYPEVYRFVLYRLGNDVLAEDIASDVFVRLLEAVKGRRGPQTNLKGWLLATASHVITDHLRRSYRRPTESLSEAIPDRSVPVTDEIERRQNVDQFKEAYAQLTFEQQNVIALRFGEGYSLEETAELMQKNVNAVKALQFRALAALQRNIGEVAHE